MRDTVNGTAVRRLIQGNGLNCASDVQEALERRVKELVEQAAARAVANNRRTVMGRDV